MKLDSVSLMYTFKMEDEMSDYNKTWMAKVNEVLSGAVKQGFDVAQSVADYVYGLRETDPEVFDENGALREDWAQILTSKREAEAIAKAQAETDAELARIQLAEEEAARILAEEEARKAKEEVVDSQEPLPPQILPAPDPEFFPIEEELVPAPYNVERLYSAFDKLCNEWAIFRGYLVPSK